MTTVTRAGLIDSLQRQIGLSRADSISLVEGMLTEWSAALERGETVKLSAFGSFSVRHKTQRVGRNPKTGEEVPILPCTVLSFRPSHFLRKKVNTESQVAETER